MSLIAVIVPTYGRADRLERVAHNILGASETSVQALFITEEDDEASGAEARRLRHENLCHWFTNRRARNYAGAVNSAYEALTQLRWPDWSHVFLAADDLDFCEGWDAAALRALESGAQVAGTNDLHNPYVLAGTHATHYLIDRRYLDSTGFRYDPDSDFPVLFEGYSHNFTDTEFIDVAKGRKVFAPCLDAVVEHRHPDWGLGPRDATFEKTRAGINGDHALFKFREHLWTDNPDGRSLL